MGEKPLRKHLETSQDTIITFLSSMSPPSVILGELAASWRWCCGVHHHFATSPPGSRHPSPLPNAMPAN